MNLKKVFAACLSVLIASTPVALCAMENDECIICFDKIKDKVITECEHAFCRECLKSWKHTEPVCPLCKRYIGEDIDLTEDFQRWGMVDVRDLPEMNGKSDEEILDYLITNYCNVLEKEFICVHAPNEIKKQKEAGIEGAGALFWYDGQCKETLTYVFVDTPNGRKQLGIADPLLRYKLNMKMWNNVILPYQLCVGRVEEIRKKLAERKKACDRLESFGITGGLVSLLALVATLL